MKNNFFSNALKKYWKCRNVWDIGYYCCESRRILSTPPLSARCRQSVEVSKKIVDFTLYHSETL